MLSLSWFRAHRTATLCAFLATTLAGVTGGALWTYANSAAAYEPEALRSRVWGMNPTQVRSLLGPPDQVHTGAVLHPDTVQDAIWEYRHRVKNPRTGEADRRVMIVFRQGVVTDLIFD